MPVSQTLATALTLTLSKSDDPRFDKLSISACPSQN